jgi:hypothetical protein
MKGLLVGRHITPVQQILGRVRARRHSFLESCGIRLNVAIDNRSEKEKLSSSVKNDTSEVSFCHNSW